MQDIKNKEKNVTIEPDRVDIIIDKMNDNKHISILESLLLFIIFGTVAAKLVPLFKTPKIIYDSITYIKESELNIRNKIKDTLNKIMGLSISDRVILAIFHNGEKNDAGVHLRKFSAISEVNERLPSIKNTLKNIPISNIEDELEYCTLFKSDWTFITTEDGNLSKECMDYMKKNTLKAKYSYVLKNKKGAYGILNIHYIDEVNDFLNENTEDEENNKRKDRMIFLIYELEKNINDLKNNTKWWHKFIKFFENMASNS